MKYRKKPVVIEAVQLKDIDKSKQELMKLMNQNFLALMYRDSKVFLMIETLEGTMIADENDYIIKGVKGEFYPCKPDIFEMSYEKVK